MMEMQKILELCIQYRSSDVHMLVGVQPYFRIYGKLVPIPDSQVLTPESIKQLINSILLDEQKELLEVDKELDFSYSIPSGERFRANVYHERGNMAIALRAIPSKILTIEELGLPMILGELTSLKQGLVLVTGPTGHGKSTTQAAMIDRINRERAEHIVTIEDPIEFLITPVKSIISQRELHADTHSWSVALRSALREDPDIVQIGEMRDFETIQSALTIAETGHLVFATLHTNSAAQTVHRIVDVFPEEQQQQVRAQLAATLQAVLAIRLLPSLDDKRTAVMEILLASPAVRNTIRENKVHLMGNIMQTSTELGMKTMEMSLAESYQKKLISLKTARDYAPSVDELNRLVGVGS